jgi:hypothetical protein
MRSQSHDIVRLHNLPIPTQDVLLSGVEHVIPFCTEIISNNQIAANVYTNPFSVCHHSSTRARGCLHTWWTLAERPNQRNSIRCHTSSSNHWLAVNPSRIKICPRVWLSKCDPFLLCITRVAQLILEGSTIRRFGHLQTISRYDRSVALHPFLVLVVFLMYHYNVVMT